MRRVVVIHGGDSFPTYEAYLASLRTPAEDIAAFRPRPSGWKASLPEALGADYDVLLPRMPNASNARYAEWLLAFEQVTPFLTDGDLLIGHSLGASFLVRLLADTTLPFRPGGVFLIAAPYANDVPEEFAAPTSLTLLAEQAERVFLYHSEDDPVVPFSELAKYEAALPLATVRTFTDRGHFFNQETFPELVADIKSL